jgi:hypothetical protein
MFGSYLIIKLTSRCDKTICTYKTYHHDAKYFFELYSMKLLTFSYELPVAAMFVIGSGRNEQSLLIEDLP